MKRVIFIVGETGSGKDTVAGFLPYKKVISYTTRPMRTYEEDGKQHYFVSDYAMDDLVDNEDFIAYTKIGEYRYGAIFRDCDADTMVYIIDPKGIEWFKDHGPKNIEYITILLHVPLIERMRRCKNRSDYEKNFMKRNKAERDMFEDFMLSGDWDYIIKNHDAYQTAKSIRKLVELKFGEVEYDL